MNTRWTQIDVLRGIFLALMAFNHTPNPLRTYTDQPLGFVSAAEGFVFLSAFLSGLVFEKRSRQGGYAAMFSYARRRAWTLYLGHLATLFFAFLVAGFLFAQLPGFSNFVAPFQASPVKAAGSSLFFLYQPPLLDILPMYVLFVLITPLFFRLSSRYGWWSVLAGSSVLWALAHWGLRQKILGNLSFLPIVEVGPFDLFSWQLLWVSGLAFGQICARRGEIPRMPAGVGLLALATSLFFFCWRSSWIPVNIDLGDLLWILDKWELGPLRLLNFFALAILLVWTAPRLGFFCKILKPFSVLGRHALLIYCIHVCVCLVLIGLDDSFDISDGTKTAMALAQLALLFGVAFFMQRRFTLAQASGPRVD